MAQKQRYLGLAPNGQSGVVQRWQLANCGLATRPHFAHGGTFHEWGGDVGVEVFEALHEFFGNTALVLVLAHLALLAGQSFWRKKNLALPMLTGRIEGKGPDLVPSNRVWLAAGLLLSVGVYWAWEFFLSLA